MKKGKVLYWIFTCLLAALMVLSAIPDVIRHPEAEAVFKHLGYPLYLLPFLGTLKLLGVVVLFLSRFPRFQEWAYAGLTFDLLGALYSHWAVGDPFGVWVLPFLGLLLVGGSILHKKYAPTKSASPEPRASQVFS